MDLCRAEVIRLQLIPWLWARSSTSSTRCAAAAGVVGGRARWAGATYQADEELERHKEERRRHRAASAATRPNESAPHSHPPPRSEPAHQAARASARQAGAARTTHTAPPGRARRGVARTHRTKRSRAVALQASPVIIWNMVKRLQCPTEPRQRKAATRGGRGAGRGHAGRSVPAATAPALAYAAADTPEKPDAGFEVH